MSLGVEMFDGLMDFYIKLWDVRSVYKPGTLKPCDLLYNHPLAPDWSTFPRWIGLWKDVLREASLACFAPSFQVFVPEW